MGIGPRITEDDADWQPLATVPGLLQPRGLAFLSDTELAAADARQWCIHIVAWGAVSGSAAGGNRGTRPAHRTGLLRSFSGAAEPPPPVDAADIAARAAAQRARKPVNAWMWAPCA